MRGASILCWQHKNNKPHSIYRNIKVKTVSTSNHNLCGHRHARREVVLYRFSTSNHNHYVVHVDGKMLYYIVSLHQTTTRARHTSPRFRLYYIVSLHQTTTKLQFLFSPCLLYYIVSLHQTTTLMGIRASKYGCIISFLYIKPQLVGENDLNG